MNFNLAYIPKVYRDTTPPSLALPNEGKTIDIYTDTATYLLVTSTLLAVSFALI